MIAHSLYIYYDTSEGERKLFPNDKSPAILHKWKYTAERQADSVPSVEATLMHARCLENEWNRLRPYVVLDNGDILYADKIYPDTEKKSDDVRFSHSLRFVSKRDILSKVLFFDAVTADASKAEKDKYRSNFTDFTFHGSLNEFVSRLESSLAFSGINDFSFVFDNNDVSSSLAEVSFSDTYMNEAIGHILSDFNVNFYWVGNVCHIGDCQHDIPSTSPLRYGRAKGLTAIKKTNSSERTINAITGFGGSTNIPYYYPNDNEYGETNYAVYNAKKSDVAVDWAKLYSKIGTKTGIELTLAKKIASSRAINIREFYNAQWIESIYNYDATDGSGMVSSGYATQATVVFTRSVNVRGGAGVTLNLRDIPNMTTSVSCRTVGGELADINNVRSVINIHLVQGGNRKPLSKSSGMTVNLDYTGLSVVEVEITSNIWYTYDTADKSPATFILNLPADPYAVLATPQDSLLYWYTGGKFLRYSEAGITLSGTYDNVAEFTSQPADNGLQGEDKIYFFNVEPDATLVSAVRMKIVSRAYVTPTGKLVPSVYRESLGSERFYYAKNHSFSDDCTDKDASQHSAFLVNGAFLSFDNVFSKDRQMQAVMSFDDIHPTIEGISNSAGQPFGSIIDVAFDDDDNDNTDSDGRYLHPYFYIRLALYDGEFGFNLLEHAIQGEEAKICMTSCNGCPSCQFTIQVIYGSDGKAYNPVILDSAGNLLPGDYKNKLASSVSSCTASNQDTSSSSIWIAVSKEDSTLGTIMPSAAAGLKPIAGDTFVLTGISFPTTYLRAAEKRLDESLVKYMAEHNSGTFDNDVTLSRIFLEENKDFAEQINENTRLWISYNWNMTQMYVSSYSVSVDDDILADISSELTSEFKA